MCVRLVDVSGILAIHIPTRSLLRSSSTHEPSDPPLRVVLWINYAGSRPSSMDFHRLRLERLAGRRSHLGLKNVSCSSYRHTGSVEFYKVAPWGREAVLLLLLLLRAGVLQALQEQSRRTPVSNIHSIASRRGIPNGQRELRQCASSLAAGCTVGLPRTPARRGEKWFRCTGMVNPVTGQAAATAPAAAVAVAAAGHPTERCSVVPVSSTQQQR